MIFLLIFITLYIEFLLNNLTSQNVLSKIITIIYVHYIMFNNFFPLSFFIVNRERNIINCMIFIYFLKFRIYFINF